MALSDQQKQDIKRRQQTLGLKPKRSKPEKWLFPLSTEREYRATLKKYMSYYIDAVRQTIIPQIPALVDEANGYRPDNLFDVVMDSWPDKIAAMIASVKVSFDENAPNPEIFVPIVAADISDFNKLQFNKVMKSVLQVDVFIAEPWLKVETASFVRENVTLVKSLETQSLTQIEGIVQRGVRGGERAEVISRQIQDQLGVVERRADLIARDQVGKFNGQLTELRQTELGVERFTWRTAGDDRVRPEHAMLDGQVFEWSSPPSEGVPGDAGISCRCYAEPVLDNLLSL